MSTAPSTIRGMLCQALLSTAKVNRAVQSAPAAVLWTDKDALWNEAIPSLQTTLPGLLTYGAYAPKQRRGPAIWLKCVVADLISEVDLKGQLPIIYLPGVSRAELRAIESCSRDLQPLAELQYRGAFWSQDNCKDWTISAFLGSKNGGLGLNVGNDKATQAALSRALVSGMLLDRPLSEMESRQINAEWLDKLLAPNPNRDILVWLNDSKQAAEQWAGGRWDVFVARCKHDYGFEPNSDGELVAAEKLASRSGMWAAVWELYNDSYTSFPTLLELLDRVQTPANRGLFDDLSAYPQFNADAEATLRDDLRASERMDEPAARIALLNAENSHGHRRGWIWARMGRSPLAQALQHLARVADLSTQAPGGTTIEQIAEKYRSGAWMVDSEAMQALAAVQTKADVDAVAAVLRAVYLPWLEKVARRFQELVVAQGGLHVNIPADPAIPNGLCVVFVDGLRYDVAMTLKARLDNIGDVKLDSTWTSIPPVTASAKPWVSPVAHLVAGKATDEEFEPRVSANGKPLSTYNFRKLLVDEGFQVLGQDQVGDPTGRAWVECGDLDHYGHEHGIRLARDLSSQLEYVVERLVNLRDAGWTHFRIITDHGWLLIPGGLPKAELSMNEVQTRWGRCAVLKPFAQGTPLTFKWDWCKEVQIAMAPGISSFRAGTEYEHGGLSLQECLVPVLEIRATQAQQKTVTVEITKITWKGLRCNVEITPEVDGLRADVRTKVAMADSSVAANIRAFDGGKASLAVADDGLMGMAAVVVVIDANGTVVQKVPTTIGE